MPAQSRFAAGSIGLVALALAVLPMPTTAAQPAATTCTAAPVVGRTGVVLYWTVRPGCVVPMAAFASGDGSVDHNTPSARQSDAEIAEIPMPVSGIAVDTPVRR
jgi:hypothetical protein